MSKPYSETIITEEFLDSTPEAIFVFGDNLVAKGTGGAAKLRHHPKALGFITKKYPNNKDSSFFRPEEYQEVFDKEVEKLLKFISMNPGRVLYISKLGAGLANRYNIWEKIIEPQIQDRLAAYSNQVTYLWQ